MKICFTDGPADLSKFPSVIGLPGKFSPAAPRLHAMHILTILRRESPNAEIYYVDAAGSQAGVYESDLAFALRTFRERVTPPYIVTFSIESDMTAWPELQIEIDWLYNNGCILVASAGNSGEQIPVRHFNPYPTGWPAVDPRPVIVGARWKNEYKRVSFSDYTWSGRRMIFANGSNVEGYQGEEAVGTSFATPLVVSRIANLADETGLWLKTIEDIVFLAGQHITIENSGADTYSVLTNLNGPVAEFKGKKYVVNLVRYLKDNPDLIPAMRPDWFDGPQAHCKWFGLWETLVGPGKNVRRLDNYFEEIGA